MIKNAIRKVVEGGSLSKEEARGAFDQIMRGEATDAQISSFITALRIKGEHEPEILGAAESMRAVVETVSYHGRREILDIVGTGGDGKGSFNVSTASAIVAAGAGCIVAKHGNRSVSSRSGAADVLEELGVNIETSPRRNSKILCSIGFTFMFAQIHHPAMKYAAQPRRDIGIRTIFNTVGPLTNPAGASTYLLGADSTELAKRLAPVLKDLGVKNAMVVHGAGHDEITLTGTTDVFQVIDGTVYRTTIRPENYGLSRCSDSDLTVSGAKESAAVIRNILEGREKGPKFETVLLNAGAGIYANMKAEEISDGIEMARESIESGRAAEKLEALIRETRKTVPA